jgi:bifunctional DNA-binding transcriptional regulator/antitoxin component of YhaV-PrlF toxin-antitoxin module
MKDIIIGKVWKAKNSIQCTIPKEFCNEMDINAENSIKFVYDNDNKSIIITKADLKNL